MNKESLNKEPLNENLLNNLLKNYKEIKDMENKYSKMAEPLNKEIKDYLLDYNIEKFEGDEYIAVISKSISEKWVEPLLIERLKKLGHPEAVKTVETIDYSKLESLLYNGVIKEAKVKDCKTITERVTLRVNNI